MQLFKSFFPFFHNGKKLNFLRQQPFSLYSLKHAGATNKNQSKIYYTSNRSTKSK